MTENDPDDLLLQRVMQESVKTAAQDGVARDAAYARKLAGEFSGIEGPAEVVRTEGDGSLERDNDPEDLALQRALQLSVSASAPGTSGAGSSGAAAASAAGAAQEAIARDAAYARQLASEYAGMEAAPVAPEVVGDVDREDGP